MCDVIDILCSCSQCMERFHWRISFINTKLKIIWIYKAFIFHCSQSMNDDFCEHVFLTRSNIVFVVQSLIVVDCSRLTWISWLVWERCIWIRLIPAPYRMSMQSIVPSYFLEPYHLSNFSIPNNSHLNIERFQEWKHHICFSIFYNKMASCSAYVLVQTGRTHLTKLLPTSNTYWRSNACRSHLAEIAAASYVLCRKAIKTSSGDFALRTTS